MGGPQYFNVVKWRGTGTKNLSNYIKRMGGGDWCELIGVKRFFTICRFTIYTDNIKATNCC